MQGLLILGGGQLSRFLAEAALKFVGRERLESITILAENESCSVVRALDSSASGSIDPRVSVILGDPRKQESLQKAATALAGKSHLTTVVFENEWIAPQTLESIFFPDRFAFAPSLEAIGTLQRKDRQKLLLQSLGVPTSPFMMWNPDAQTLESWVTAGFTRHSDGLVLKWGSEGYDGKGTWISDANASTSSNLESALIFASHAQAQGVPLFAESKIPFVHELSILGVRSAGGQIEFYPLSISEQIGGICVDNYGPATEFNIPRETEIAAQEIWRKIADELDYIGVMAVELFYTESPPGLKNSSRLWQLWVNEIAPRVHNTGHHTLDSFRISQFEAHLRASLGYILPELTPRSPFFGMRNVIGDSPYSLESEPLYHDYQKSPARAGRKMGHLNFVASSRESLVEQMEKFSWLKKLAKK